MLLFNFLQRELEPKRKANMLSFSLNVSYTLDLFRKSPDEDDTFGGSPVLHLSI